MNDYFHLKEELFKVCEQFVDKKLSTIEAIISSNQKALQSETKSSAGDKHETGRAMLQLEMEKAGKQLIDAFQMKETIKRINISKTSNIIHLGSIVFTTNMNYFISVSAGEITVDNQKYFAVSTHSPIGKLLLGKQSNKTVICNDTSIQIIEVK